MEKQILQVDMNNFYASVECMLDTSLRGKPVAVCGSTEERHGIVLAKNYIAKAYGVTTGEATWQARQKCPDLLIKYPHYEEYLRYSDLARQIYERYTDQIEPFGMDECWLDVTGSAGLFGKGSVIAQEIRQRVKFELGLTVSIGVSFNKVFAKLGSDYRKPDAVTVFDSNNWKELIWPLPVEDLLGVGRATSRVMRNFGIHTIGELAACDPHWLYGRLKSRAFQLHRFANGEDNSVVLHKDFEIPAKSVGHGITTLMDLENDADVWKVMLELCQEIGRKLALYRKKALGVAIYIRDNELEIKQWQTQLLKPSASTTYIARCAYDLFTRSFQWPRPIRSVTVSAINLCEDDLPLQYDLFNDAHTEEKLMELDRAIYGIRERYGDNSIRNAVLIKDLKMQTGRTEVRMPPGLTTMAGG